MSVDLLNHAMRLLVGRLHSRGELRSKLLRVVLRSKARSERAELIKTKSDAHSDHPRRTKLNEFDRSAFEGTEHADSSHSSDVDAVLNQLETRGLLSDDQFAEWHVEQRVSGPRPRSRAQIAGELIAKRVNGDVVREAIRNYSDVDAAAHAAARKPHLSDSDLRKHLNWKAFSSAAIQTAIASRREMQSSTATPPPQIHTALSPLKKGLS
jgi:SOS response regulatory protein OraA/RecX